MKPTLNLTRSVLLVSLLLFFYGFTKTDEGEIYKDWDYSPTSVYGINKLANTTNRGYYKITKVDSLSTRIQ